MSFVLKNRAFYSFEVISLNRFKLSSGLTAYKLPPFTVWTMAASNPEYAGPAMNTMYSNG